jgi:ATP-dependent exoDNAse (exonuclease V) beta subunit
MENKPFIIYKSSAGSGKTYTLTLEYLKLALKSPQSAFRQILAVTFTNKATQEMKERILKDLKRLRSTVRPGEKMDDELMKSLGVDEDGLKARAGEALTAILHDYGHFAVSTIDSFFQRVVRSFAREMDLNAKFEVELDQQAVLDRVVDRVVMLVMEDEFLHKWLVDYAYEQIQSGKSWDIRRNIRNLGGQIFQEDFKRYATEIKEFLKEKENITKLQAFARERRSELIQIARQLKDQANSIRINNGLEWTDFKGGSNTFAKKFDQLGDRKQPVPELTDPQRKLIDNLQAWYTAKSPCQSRIEAAYAEGLNQILAQFDPLNFQWNTLEAIAKNIYVFGIFRNLLDELSAVKDEESILLISDANEFLKEITKENDAPFIYEKVGNQYRNFLIDEFQDTSGFQWASFKPLLENSLSQGNTNLLVGDVKQSIYRWRGGEMKLLLEQVEAETGVFGIDVRDLDTNFRSLPNIIAFNNALFNRLPASFESYLREKYAVEDASVLSRAYRDVKQQISSRKAELPFQGKVRIDFVDCAADEEEGNFADRTIARLPGMIRELQDHGYSPSDIAFLVRTKKEGEAIAEVLMREQAINLDPRYRFDVLSDESMFLTKSASVKALVAGLRYLQFPDDLVQFKTMWYYRSVLRDEPVDHHLFALDKTPAHLVEKVRAFRESEVYLLQLPLMEALEELIRILDLMENDVERAYISGFKEAVYDFTANNRSDLAGFLDWWEVNQEKRTVKVPDGHDAMRILTIHKSKGLQFKVVLMPFLKWTIFDSTKGNVVWSPFEDRAKGLSAIIPLTLNGDLAKSDFSYTYSEEAILAYLDSLNMIYVALTRAEDVFWGVAPYKQKLGSLNFLESHLQLLMENTGEPNGEIALWEHYNRETKVFELGDWPAEMPSHPETISAPALRWAYQNWSELLQVKKYAVDFSPKGLEQRKKRNFGTLVHEILEKSLNLNAAKEILQSFYFEGRLSDSEKTEVEKQLVGLFANPVFAGWFEGDGVLLSEQGILLPGGRQKRPDRIILREHESIIVDFKTGEEREKYGSQVKEYMTLVQDLTQKPVRGFLCYLETGKIEQI